MGKCVLGIVVLVKAKQFILMSHWYYTALSSWLLGTDFFSKSYAWHEHGPIFWKYRRIPEESQWFKGAKKFNRHGFVRSGICYCMSWFYPFAAWGSVHLNTAINFNELTSSILSVKSISCWSKVNHFSSSKVKTLIHTLFLCHNPCWMTMMSQKRCLSQNLETGS